MMLPEHWRHDTCAAKAGRRMNVIGNVTKTTAATTTSAAGTPTASPSTP
jgi:hypothetical protein